MYSRKVEANFVDACSTHIRHKWCIEVQRQFLTVEGGVLLYSVSIQSTLLVCVSATVAHIVGRILVFC